MGDVNLEIKLKNLEEKVDELEIGAVEVDNMTITRNVANELEIAPEVTESINNSAIGVQTNTSDINTINETLSESADWLKSKNRINNIEQGGLDDGLTPISSTIRLRTGYVEVEPNKPFTISVSASGFKASVSYFNVADNVTARTGTSGWQSLPCTLNAGSTTRFVKIIFAKDNDGIVTVSEIGNVQLEEGTEATEYQPYSDSNVELTAKLSQVEKQVFSPNIFDMSKATDGYYLSPSDGKTAIAQSSSFYSDYIEVEPNTDYTISGMNSFRYFYMNASKNLIATYEGSSPKTIKTPIDCVYIRIHGDKSYKSTLQIEKGSSATNYQSFSKSNVQLTEELAGKEWKEVTTTLASGISAYSGIGLNVYTNANEVMIELGVIKSSAFTNNQQIGTYEADKIPTTFMASSGADSNWGGNACIIEFQNGIIKYHGANTPIVLVGSITKKK